MKRPLVTVVVLTLIAVAAGPLSAQTASAVKTDFRVTSIVVSTGETPLTSGLTVDLFAESSRYTDQFTANADFGQFIVRRKFRYFSLGPTFGIFKNAVWVAPMLCSTFGPFSTTHWIGPVAGRPDHPSIKEANFFFSIQSVGLAVGPLSATYTLQHFLEELPKHLLTVDGSFRVGGNLKMGGGWTQDFRARRPLFALMAKYNFK